MVHGEIDPRVPFEQATLYIDAARQHGREELVKLISFPQVGHPGHYGGITEAEEAQRQSAIAAQLSARWATPQLPEAGSLVVAGYVRTRHFSVVLESIDHIARLDYDLGSGTFALQAPTSRTAALTLADGGATELNCEEISLPTLCQWLALPVMPG